VEGGIAVNADDVKLGSGVLTKAWPKSRLAASDEDDRVFDLHGDVP
jgi:hypothetical protein